jgi:uncharacterized protein (TIGR00255 family)
MIASMTGYGKAEAVLAGIKLTIEIKSLNSKQTDISVKLPSLYREKEPEIRNLIMQQLERGKIDFYTYAEITGDISSFTINKPLALHYYRELKDLLSEMMENSDPDLLPVIMKMPDVLQSSREDISESDWKTLKQAIEEAISGVLEFRTGEGKILENDFRSRVGLIMRFLGSIDPFEKKRTTDIRERLVKEFEKLSRSEASVVPDQNRFEQELIFYLEKLDITEEKVRLRKHCSYFLETLDEKTSQGKKLGFIVQEMGREINTIGSKANDAEIQRVVVQMKDELEKIKEQLSNIL